MKRTCCCFLIAICLSESSGFSTPQAAPSAVTIKRFKDIPVEMATGELVQHEAPDLSVKSRGLALDVSRNYRSRREANSIFGYGWAWNHAEHLEFPGDFVINYVTPEGTIPIYPDVSYTSAYARVCMSAPGWEGGGKATGAPDAIGGYGNVAHYYGAIGSLQPLVVGGWDFLPPAGASTILQVDVTSIGATAYDSDHPQYGVSMKLSAGGASSVTWGHRAYDFDYVNVTADRSVWSWDDVNNLRARLELGSYLQNADMDVVADTFHVGVIYTKNASGEFRYLPGTQFELAKTNGEYRLQNKNHTELVFALDGRLLRKADANGNTLYFHYDPMGRLSHVSDALNQAITFRYENELANAKVAGIRDHFGRRVDYAYDGDDLVCVTNVLGHTVRYDYAATLPQSELRHNLVRRTDPEGCSVSVAYYTTNSTPDRVRSYWDGEMTDGRSNEVDYLYLKGTTYSYVPGSGSIQGVVYNASNDVSQVYIREGELTYQDSDGINLIASHAAQSVSSPLTSAWENIECALGETNGLMAHNAALGTNSYLDVSNWGFSVPGMSNDIVQVAVSLRGCATNAVRLSALGMTFTNWVSTNTQWVTLNITGDKSRWTWADISNLTARLSLVQGTTNPVAAWVDGVMLQVRYRHFDPGRDPSDTFYFYDLAHNVVSTDRGGVVHQFAYDTRGNLTAWTDPEGNVRRYEYDPVFDTVTRSWDALGRVTVMDYDRQGRLIRTTDPLGQSSSRDYDAFGNCVRITDPAGFTETTHYDTNGLHVLSTLNRRGFETTYDYDAYGNCIRITDPCGGSRHAEYNGAGWKVRERDEAGVETRFEHDRDGRLIQTVKSAGTREEAVTTIRYDGRGLPKENTDPLGRAEHTEYDIYGRPVCQTDRLGRTTITEYDLEDFPVRVFDACGEYAESIYDERGNITAHFDKRGFGTTVAYDGNNNPISVTDKGGNRVTKTYDANGNVLEEIVRIAGWPGCPLVKIPEPLTTVYAYDAVNRVVRKVVGTGRPDARVYLTEYDAAGRVIGETDPLGNARRMAYDANGNRTTCSLFDAGGRLISRELSVYDPADRLVAEIKGLGTLAVTNRYEYDSRGLKVAGIDARGNRTTFTYDTQQHLTATIDPLGHVHGMSYDRAGNKIREWEASGAITEYAWDAAGCLTNKIVGAGLADARTFVYRYDTLGRLTRETDPLGYHASWTYDAEGNVLGESNKLGCSKTYSYDAMGRVTNTIDEAGFQTRQSLDGRGHPRLFTDKLGRVTVSEYDVYGHLISLTDGLGGQARWTYDSGDRKIRETDPRGLVTCYAYDAEGRETNKTIGVGLAGALVYDTDYDSLGRAIMFRNPAGGVVVQEFDAAGNCVARTDARGAVTRYTYDALNRQTRLQDAHAGVTQTGYDDRGNIATITDPLGGTTRFGYDAYNLKRSMTDASGQTTRYEYDRMGRVVTTTDALGHFESQSYDAEGRCISARDKNGAISRFSFDSLGRVTNTVDALGFQTHKTYDAAGNMLTATDKRGNTTTYHYDVLNRVIAVTDPASNSVFSAYDAAGNTIRKSLPSGLVTTYGYDWFGRLVIKTAGAGQSDPRRVRHEYDPRGCVTREIDPYGYDMRTQYDANGNKTNITDRRGYSTRMEYDALNRLVKTTDALGNASFVEYDALGRIVATTNRRGHSTRHAYDKMGRLTSIEDAEGNVSSNRYDVLGRRCEEIAPNGRHTWLSYDAAGQLTNTVVGALGAECRSQGFGYDALGRQCRMVDALGGVTLLDHDPNGNVTRVAFYSSSGDLLRERSLQYDSRNQVVLACDYLGHICRTEYDSIGRKIADVDPLGNRTAYQFSIFDEIISVTDPGGYCTRTRYDRCGREIEVINALGQHTRWEYDANGNRSMVINDNGHVVATGYDALNRVCEVNRTMPEVALDVLRRADVNGDGLVNDDDVTALEGELP